MLEQNLEAVKYNEAIQVQLNQICEPLRKNLGIEDLVYIQLYENNKAFLISTHIVHDIFE